MTCAYLQALFAHSNKKSPDEVFLVVTLNRYLSPSTNVIVIIASTFFLCGFVVWRFIKVNGMIMNW